MERESWRIHDFQAFLSVLPMHFPRHAPYPFGGSADYSEMDLKIKHYALKYKDVVLKTKDASRIMSNKFVETSEILLQMSENLLATCVKLRQGLVLMCERWL